MAIQQVSPGDWIEIQLPTDSWPVHIAVGNTVKRPAFIDHIRADGGVQTWAKIRCPQLKRGSYKVIASMPGGSVEHTVSIR